jgi:predicted Zn-dependent peptidase
LEFKLNQICLVIGLVSLAFFAGLTSGQADRDQLIRDQEGTQRIGLSNGIELVVVSTEEYRESDVQVWLIVRAGSMYERDDERGAAVVYERMIRSGTKHFTSEEIDQILAQGGADDRRYDGSFVGFDHAGFFGSVDKDDPAAMERLLGFFGDVLDSDSRAPESEQSEDQINEVVDGVIAELIEEINQEPSAELRSRREWLPELMRGSLFGKRLPMADIEELNRLTALQVREFGDAFYHPGQAMLIVLGDVDPKLVESQAATALGSIVRGERDSIVDGRMKIDVSQRAVIGTDPELENQQGAMVWFQDHGDESIESWSMRAGQYSVDDMRTTVINRAAGEIIRHRLGMLSAQELGTHSEIGVEQIDLFGQVDLLQIGVESSDGKWEDSIRFLVRECDRLDRDGATDAEVSRARRSLLARWHRDADDWITRDNAQRMRLVHWLITTGRPMIDMVRWDQLATELMTDIRDDEISQAVRGFIVPQNAAYVALAKHGNQGLGDEDPGTRRQNVMSVVEEALLSPRDPIHPRWMEQIVGDLIDTQPTGGEILEITQHSDSEVWGASLDNGVRLWARSMENDTGRVYLNATLWGTIFENGTMSEDEILAAITAWQSPATESRGSRVIAAYLAEYGIEIAAKRDVRMVQLSIESPLRSVDQAMELMYVLLSRPMIEGDAFSNWQDRRALSKEDPLDRALKVLYANDAIKQGHSNEITLDDAQRALTQIVRNAQIDIGIAGAVESQGLIARGAELFGSLVDREPGELNKEEQETTHVIIKSDRVASVSSATNKEHGAVIGFVGGSNRDLRAMRSMILSTMVMSNRIRDLSEAHGFDGHIRAHMGYSDEISDQMLMMVRARCSNDDLDAGYEIIDQSIDAMVRDGISEEELAIAQRLIDASIAKYFDTPMYWSMRLSSLGAYGRRVDDLWGIREGYTQIDADYASQVFRELITGNDRFRVEITE